MERLDVKQALYRKLDAVRRPGTAVSSNTSTIPLAHADQGMPETFRARLPHHALLQPAALHAAAGNRDRRRDRSRQSVDAVAQFADVASWARASSAARTAPASSPTASASTGCKSA